MPLQYVIIQHFESKTRGWVTCVDLGNVKQRADVILKGGDHRGLFLKIGSFVFKMQFHEWHGKGHGFFLMETCHGG